LLLASWMVNWKCGKRRQEGDCEAGARRRKNWKEIIGSWPKSWSRKGVHESRWRKKSNACEKNAHPELAHVQRKRRIIRHRHERREAIPCRATGRTGIDRDADRGADHTGVVRRDEMCLAEQGEIVAQRHEKVPAERERMIDLRHAGRQ